MFAFNYINSIDDVNEHLDLAASRTSTFICI